MTTALSGLSILVFVLPGFVVAKATDLFLVRHPAIRSFRQTLHAAQEKILTASLFILLFLMGLRLMADPQVAGNLPVLGARALAYAGMTVLLSVLGALPLGIRAASGSVANGQLAEAERPEASQSDLRLEAENRQHPLRKLSMLFLSPLKLLLFVVAGSLAVVFVPPVRGLPISLLTDICLKVMLVAVGLGLGFTPFASMAGSFNRRALALPFITMAASLAAGALGSLFLVDSLGRSMAVSAGFGWYSLSGILIADMGNPELGALAFLANLFRESIALLSIPLLQHWKKSGSAIAAAGATSMDVALPVLSLYGAAPLLPLAVYHGFILSLAVPFLVPVLMGV